MLHNSIHIWVYRARHQRRKFLRFSKVGKMYCWFVYFQRVSVKIKTDVFVKKNPGLVFQVTAPSVPTWNIKDYKFMQYMYIIAKIYALKYLLHLLCYLKTTGYTLYRSSRAKNVLFDDALECVMSTCSTSYRKLNENRIVLVRVEL